MVDLKQKTAKTKPYIEEKLVDDIRLFRFHKSPMMKECRTNDVELFDVSDNILSLGQRIAYDKGHSFAQILLNWFAGVPYQERFYSGHHKDDLVWNFSRDGMS